MYIYIGYIFYIYIYNISSLTIRYLNSRKGYNKGLETRVHTQKQSVCVREKSNSQKGK